MTVHTTRQIQDQQIRARIVEMALDHDPDGRWAIAYMLLEINRTLDSYSIESAIGDLVGELERLRRQLSTGRD